MFIINVYSRLFNYEFRRAFLHHTIRDQNSFDLRNDSESLTYLAHLTCRSGRCLSGFRLQSSDLSFQLDFFHSTAGLHLPLPGTHSNPYFNTNPLLISQHSNPNETPATLKYTQKTRASGIYRTTLHLKHRDHLHTFLKLPLTSA